MNSIFVDTSAWYALTNGRDQNHSRAKSFFSGLTSDYGKLVTTSLVIGETYTLLRMRAGYDVAAGFLKAVHNSSLLMRIHVSEETDVESYRLLRRFSEIDLSYIDATSIVTMKSHAISDCFAFDRHFAAAGLTLLPS